MHAHNPSDKKGLCAGIMYRDFPYIQHPRTNRVYVLVSHAVCWPAPLQSLVHAEGVGRLRPSGTRLHEVERVASAHGAHLQLTATATLVPTFAATGRRLVR